MLDADFGFQIVTFSVQFYLIKAYVEVWDVKYQGKHRALRVDLSHLGDVQHVRSTNDEMNNLLHLYFLKHLCI